jgi:hypothetical protein
MSLKQRSGLRELIRISIRQRGGSRGGRAQLANFTVPLIWDGRMSAVLKPKTSLQDQGLLLASREPSGATIDDLERFIEPKTESYLIKTIRKLHAGRLVEFNKATGTIRVLPPGAAHIIKLIEKEKSKKV